MEVSVWSSDWGIPSIDPMCLEMIAYAKFSGAPLQVRETNNPFWTPRSNLPVFSHATNTKKLAEFSPFVDYLRKCKYSANYNLTPKELSEVSALCHLIEEKLYPSYLYIFWMDPKNHIELVRPWFAQHIAFPLNLYYLPKLRQRAVDIVESRFGCREDDPALEAAVYKAAEQTLTLLSRRLGSEPYLFGKSPSSADAVLYAHLAPILKAPLPNPSLQNHLKACTNLVAFVSRVTQKYFPQIGIDYDKKMKEKVDQSQNNEAANRQLSPSTVFAHFRSKEFLNQFFSCIVAATAMAAYAHFSGLYEAVRDIQVKFVSEDEDEEEIEE